jgi:hypothetical protein
MISATITAGDFNNDGFADWRRRHRRGQQHCGVGAVNVLYGSSAGLTGVGSQLFTQDSSGVGNTGERNDWFLAGH